MSKVRSLSKRLISLLCAAFTIAALMTVLPASIIASAANASYRLSPGSQTVYLTAGKGFNSCIVTGDRSMVSSWQYKGPSSNQVNVNITENDTGKERTAYLYFYNQYGGLLNYYTIKQNKTAITSQKVSVTPDGLLKFNVTTNCPFSVTVYNEFNNNVWNKLEYTTVSYRNSSAKVPYSKSSKEHGKFSTQSVSYRVEIKLMTEKFSQYKQVLRTNEIGGSDKTLWTSNADTIKVTVAFRNGIKKSEESVTLKNKLTYRGNSTALKDLRFSTVIGDGYEHIWTQLENCNWKSLIGQDNGPKYLYWDNPHHGYVICTLKMDGSYETFNNAIALNKDWEFTISDDYSTLTLKKLNDIKSLKNVPTTVKLILQ